MFIHLYMYIYTYIHTHVCMYVYIYRYMRSDCTGYEPFDSVCIRQSKPDFGLDCLLCAGHLRSAAHRSRALRPGYEPSLDLQRGP